MTTTKKMRYFFAGYLQHLTTIKLALKDSLVAPILPALVAFLISLTVSCGVQGGHSPTQISPKATGIDAYLADTSANSNIDVSPTVRACQKTQEGNGKLALANSVTYTTDLYPITQNACSECHKSSLENRANSTNCFYLRDHLDNVIQRFKNARDAAGFVTANPNATKDSIMARYTKDAKPMPPIDKTPLSDHDIGLFDAWRGTPNPCGEADSINSEILIPKIDQHSSDSEDSNIQNLNRVFATASCEDGPSVNTDEAWALFQDTFKGSSNGIFYDYIGKKPLPNVNIVLPSCTMADLISSLAQINGASEVLNPYASYGWRAISCGAENGLPFAAIGTLTRITTTLGDYVYGVNIKNIRLHQPSAANEGANP